jgi:uncharacterized RDD family membrane protein YckC
MLLVLGVGSALLALLGARPAWDLIQLSSHHHGSGVSLGGYVGRVCVFAGISAMYYPLVMQRANGRTIGKWLLGIRVIRIDGRPMSWRSATFREVVLKVMIVDCVAGIPFVGAIAAGVLVVADYLRPLTDHESRALHDVLAGTRVVKS